MSTLAKSYAPTSFDPKGAAFPDRHDWYVVAVAETRDSDPLEQSNFAAALALLGGESDTVEVHEMSHWGPGWIRKILVAPSRLGDAEAIEDRLSNYPVLDDDDFSARELEAYDSAWDSRAVRDLAAAINSVFSISALTVDTLGDASPELAREHYEAAIISGDFRDASGGPVPRRAAERMTRASVAAFVRAARREARRA